MKSACASCVPRCKTLADGVRAIVRREITRRIELRAIYAVDGRGCVNPTKNKWRVFIAPGKMTGQSAEPSAVLCSPPSFLSTAPAPLPTCPSSVVLLARSLLRRIIDLKFRRNFLSLYRTKCNIPAVRSYFSNKVSSSAPLNRSFEDSAPAVLLSPFLPP